MYKITFCQLDGQSVSFDKITEIRVGKSIQELKPISENEILTFAFPRSYLYHLLGEKLNIVFSNSKTDYISVIKTSD